MRWISMIFIATLLAALAFAGCYTKGPTKAAHTSANIESYMQGLTRATGDIDRVVSSLNQLAEGKGDFEPQLNNFKDAVAALEAQAARVRSIRDAMKGSKEEYLANWKEKNAQIRDDDLRKTSEARHAETLEVFEKLRKDLTARSTDFNAFMGKIKDVENYLEVNLNPSGIRAITGKVEEIGAMADPIKEQIESVLVDLEDLVARMRAGV